MCKALDTVLMMGHLNAKVNTGSDGEVVANYDFALRNARGDPKVAWCEVHNCIIGLNTVLAISEYGKV